MLSLFCNDRPSLTFETTATEEFDRLCFEYGLELDEDVCWQQYEKSCILTMIKPDNEGS